MHMRAVLLIKRMNRDPGMSFADIELLFSKLLKAVIISFSLMELCWVSLDLNSPKCHYSLFKSIFPDI